MLSVFSGNAYTLNDGANSRFCSGRQIWELCVHFGPLVCTILSCLGTNRYFTHSSSSLAGHLGTHQFLVIFALLCNEETHQLKALLMSNNSPLLDGCAGQLSKVGSVSLRATQNFPPEKDLHSSTIICSYCFYQIVPPGNTKTKLSPSQLGFDP